MFEEFTFEAILARMLDTVSDSFDKREGSVMYDACAPAALELANFYTYLDMVLNEVFADTASYYFLVKRAAERGMQPRMASTAICKMAVTPADTAITNGDRLALDDLIYVVVGTVEGEAGAYEVQCETAGAIGNQQYGTLLPVEYIDGLETANLTEILIPGEDDEDVDTFRYRYLNSFQSQAFAGNQADYSERVNAIDGVGGCRIVRHWTEDYRPADMLPSAAVTEWVNAQSAESTSESVYAWLKLVHDAAAKQLLTVGGTVEILIINSEFNAPSSVLIDTVQQTIDPVTGAGEGEGIAPIGHVVHVVGVQNQPIDFDFDISYVRGYAWEDVCASAEEIIDGYLLEMRQNWEATLPVIRSNQLETRLLEIEGIADITQTLMNGQTENLTIPREYIPVRGEVNG